MAKTDITCGKCSTRNRVPNAAKGKPRCAKCHADLPWLVNVDEPELNEIIQSSKVPVLVDLWAPWCGPCLTIAPALVELSSELAGSVRIAKVNVDTSQGVTTKYGTRSIPTLLLFSGGAEIGRQIGAVGKEAIRRWIEESVARSAAG